MKTTPFLLGGTAVVSLLVAGAGFWTCSGQLERLGREEARRLALAFSIPVAEAAGREDDLALIREIKRLRELPGVQRARRLRKPPAAPAAPAEGGLDAGAATPGKRAAAPARNAVFEELFFEGQSVGFLEVVLSGRQGRLAQHAFIERASFIILLVLLMSFGIGWGLDRRIRRRTEQVRRNFQQWRKDRRRLRQTARELVQLRGYQARVLSEALERIPDSVILLDSSQRILAHNTRARQRWPLKGDSRGRHLLDVLKDLPWAEALARSLERPNVPIPAQINGSEPPPFLLTHSSSAGSQTWVLMPGSRP